MSPTPDELPAVTQPGCDISVGLFPNGSKLQTNRTNPSNISSEIGTEVGFTHFRHIHQPLSISCPQFVLLCLGFTRVWTLALELFYMGFLRSGVPLGVKPAGSDVKECACARASVCRVGWSGRLPQFRPRHSGSLHHLTRGKFPNVPRRDNISTLLTCTHPCNIQFMYKNASFLFFHVRLFLLLLVSSDQLELLLAPIDPTDLD